jgi:serine/threonine protein kinase/Tol biopolymer transport system component
LFYNPGQVMALTIGTQLGSHEITALLGKGGMGEVYRARDLKLKREVAIKVLPEEFARDTDRVARFQREAEVLASLNHPNIAGIHELAEANGSRFLVLELVEGETLADRIARGPIPVEETLTIAKQICEALEAAHERGIIHRDLKPANVKLTQDGKVKVLDFGLAKAMEHTSTSAALSHSPTLLSGTMGGMIIGTAAYMSPEQAKGRSVDRRSDIFAFGCVLFEMLSGEPAFPGEDVTEILGRVVTAEPDWSKLPPALPPAIQRLIRRALKKDVRQRLGDIHDAKLDIEDAVNAPARPAEAKDSTIGKKRGASAWTIAAAALFALTIAVLGFLYFKPKPTPPAEVTRFEIAQPTGLGFSSTFSLSPDGRKLAFVTSGRPFQIAVHTFDSGQSRVLAATDGATGPPFWSPDSRYIVFWAVGKLQKIEATGGPTQTLCSLPTSLYGGFWTRDDKIVFGVNSQIGLFQIAASGGMPAPLTQLESGEARHGYPSLLPDGKHFVYMSATSPTAGGIFLASLDAKPSEQGKKKLLSDVSPTALVESAGTVYLLFLRAGTLMVQRLDTKSLELAGEAVPIAEQIAFNLGVNGFSASMQGTLIYRIGAGQAEQLSWFDRQGKSLGVAGDPANFAPTSAPALSPDGKKVAIARIDQQSGNQDIWLYEFARGVNTRFTFDPGIDQNPVWSPDGSQIAFSAQRNNVWGIYRKAANLVGDEELLSKTDVGLLTSWSRDGRYALYQSGNAGVWALPVDSSGSREQKPIPLLPREFNQRGARFSPDGKFFSYLSTESGKDEVYVRTFDPSGSDNTGKAGKWMVSKDGGGGAHWRADGKEILYLAPDQTMMSVEVTTTPVFQAGVPKPLFKSSASIFWDVTPDGQRFLLRVPVGANSAAPFSVVLNWPSLIQKFQ